MVKQSLTFKQYLAALPDDRSREIEKVWRAVRRSMPKGYTEQIGPKFLSFMAGEEWYVALANQKNYISLHLIPLYVFPEMKAKFDEVAGNLKCGKGCINFKRAEDLPLDVIGEIIGERDASAFQQHMRQIRSAGRAQKNSA